MEVKKKQIKIDLNSITKKNNEISSLEHLKVQGKSIQIKLVFHLLEH